MIPGWLSPGFVAAWAALYRWRGMSSRWKRYFPRPFNQIAFSFPFGAVTWHHWTDVLWVNVLQLLVVWGLTTLVVLSGHGRWMDLGTSPKDNDDTDPERLEVLVQWLYVRLVSHEWRREFGGDALYDYLGMAVKGAMICLPAGLASLNLPFILAGSGMALMYYLSHRLGWGTAGGEWLSGGFLALNLCICY